MNIVDHIESYEKNNSAVSNGKTKFASIHIAMLGLATGLTRDEVEAMLQASASIFIKLMEDIDRVDEEFDFDTYVDSGLKLYDHLTAVSIYEEKDMKEIFVKGE